jgi:hypothetical protein
MYWGFGRTYINQQRPLLGLSSSPRKSSKENSWICNCPKTERKHFIYYCSPYEVDCTVKCVHYWQPYRGGKCRTFLSTLIEKHLGLYDFAASKIATAYLLKALEAPYCIAKEAVLVEF